MHKSIEITKELSTREQIEILKQQTEVLRKKLLELAKKK